MKKINGVRIFERDPIGETPAISRKGHGNYSLAVRLACDAFFARRGLLEKKKFGVMRRRKK